MASRRKGALAAPLGSAQLGPVESHLFNDVHCELLAFLHYYVVERLPPTSFLKETRKHLGLTIGSKYTLEQLDRSLGHLWQHWGPVNGKPSVFKQLSSLGLKCLPRIPKHFADEVRRRAEDVKGRAAPPRVLRSASRTPNTPRTQPAKRLVRKACRQTTSKRRHVREAISPSSRATEANFPDSVPQEHLPTRNDRRSGQLLSGLQPVENTPTAQARFKTELPVLKLTDSQEATSEDGLTVSPVKEQARQNSVQSSCTYDSISGPESPTPKRPDPESTTTSPDFQTPDSRRDAGPDRIHNLETDLEILKIQKINEIAYLRDCCDNWQAKYVQLQADYGRLQATASIRGSGLANINDTGKLQEKYSQLKRELSKLQKIMSFSVDSLETFPRINKTMAVEDMNLINAKLRDVLQDHGTGFTFCQSTFASREELAVLCRRCFGVDVGQAINTADVEAIFAGVSIRSAFRCLLSAAICEWVFEADMRTLFQECDRLYLKLRELLMKQSKHPTVF